MTEKQTIWLTNEQQIIWRDYLRAVAKIDRYLDLKLREFGIDHGVYEILVSLSESKGQTLRMSDLSDQVFQSRSRLTHTVNRMEKLKLVKREHCTSDGRGVNASLTKKGMELLKEIAPFHVESVRKVFIDLIDPEDFKVMGRNFKRIVNHQL